MTLGRRIRHLRSLKLWSQVELARRIGVGQCEVSKYELDMNVPSLPRLIALADAFRISLDALVGRTVKEAA